MRAAIKQILDKKDDPTLKQAQKFVEGWVELIRVNGGVLLINEEGKLKNLPLNHWATAKFEETYGKESDCNLGNAIYIPYTVKSDWHA